MASPAPDTPTNAILRRLGLPPSRSPNAHSDAAEAAVVDAKSGVAYFGRLLTVIPTVPRRTGAEEVRSFLHEVYEWGNFIIAALHAFADAVERDSYGNASAHRLLTPLGNILRELYDGLGVRLQLEMRPDRFAEAAREWTAAEQREARRAIARCRLAVRDVVLKPMTIGSSVARASRPTLTPLERQIAELVFREGPLTGKGIERALPTGFRTNEQNIRRVFAEKLIPRYGFTNPRDRTGYHAPTTRTW